MTGRILVGKKLANLANRELFAIFSFYMHGSPIFSPCQIFPVYGTDLKHVYNYNLYALDL